MYTSQIRINNAQPVGRGTAAAAGRVRVSFSGMLTRLVLSLLLAAVLTAAMPAAGEPGGSSHTAAAAETKSSRKGWFTKDGKTCYYKNGKRVTGLVRIKGKNYAFNDRGVLQVSTRLFKSGNKYYRTNSKGVAVRWTGVYALAAERLMSEEIGGDLKKAFRWSADTLRFTSSVKAPSSRKESAIAAYYGKIGFKTGSGDCYVQAYTFWWMAKVLGYKATAVRGSVQSRDKTTGKIYYASHAWCEIKEGGKTYVYDPNFTHEYAARLNNPDCGWRITYGAKNTLQYKK